MIGEDIDSDVELDFTRHALQRLRERFGLATIELGRLLHSSFQFELFRTKAEGPWRMIIPLKFSFIGIFEDGRFIVKTVLANVEHAFRKNPRKAMTLTLRISNIHYPRFMENVEDKGETKK